MAPEIRAGESHSFSADIWSLGQLCYQLLSVPGDKMRYLLPERNTYWINGVKSEVKDLITAMVSTDPTQRPKFKKIMRHPFFNRVSLDVENL
mmetsp:Transcript_41733/g.54963  ORF Transcript_41733/g.54963 Transcript_41733/m.54963 type:complete len:92 (+) Transcript_41733:1118-1393(+)